MKLAGNLPCLRRCSTFLLAMAVGGDVGLDGDLLAIILVGDGVVAHVLGLPMRHHGLQLAMDAAPPRGICSHVLGRMGIVFTMSDPTGN